MLVEINKILERRFKIGLPEKTFLRKTFVLRLKVRKGARVCAELEQECLRKENSRHIVPEAGRGWSCSKSRNGLRKVRWAGERMKVFPSTFPNKYLSPQYLPSYGNLVQTAGKIRLCWSFIESMIRLESWAGEREEKCLSLVVRYTDIDR